jgi:hypothetical protein
MIVVVGVGIEGLEESLVEYSRGAKAFLAVGKVLKHPAMRPAIRAFSTMHALAYRLSKSRAQSAKYPTMLLTVTGRKRASRARCR